MEAADPHPQSSLFVFTPIRILFKIGWASPGDRNPWTKVWIRRLASRHKVVVAPPAYEAGCM